MEKKDRREFLKQAGTGALGIGAILAGLANSDKVFARLFSRYSAEHIDELMMLVRSGSPTFEADSHLIDLFNRIAGSVDSNPALQEVVDRVIEYFEGVDIKPGAGTGLLGLPKGESDAVAGAYLAALGKLSSGIETREIEGMIPRVPAWLESLEPGFFANYAETLQGQMAASRGLSSLVAVGGEHLQGVFERIEADSSAMEGEDLRLRCRIGKRRVPCWLWFLIVIIIIIIIIATKNPQT